MKDRTKICIYCVTAILAVDMVIYSIGILLLDIWALNHREGLLEFAITSDYYYNCKVEASLHGAMLIMIAFAFFIGWTGKKPFISGIVAYALTMAGCGIASSIFAIMIMVGQSNKECAKYADETQDFISNIDLGTYDGQGIIRNSKNLDYQNVFDNLTEVVIQQCQQYKKQRSIITGIGGLGFIGYLLSVFLFIGVIVMLIASS